MCFRVNDGFKLSVSFQSCLTLCDPIDCSLPGSSVQGILQARILGWVVIPFSKGSSWPREWTQVSCIASRFFTVWATRKSPCASPQPVNLWTQELVDRGLGSWVLILPLQNSQCHFGPGVLFSAIWGIRCIRSPRVYSPL